jgi:hypothetical protein
MSTQELQTVTYGYRLRHFLGAVERPPTAEARWGLIRRVAQEIDFPVLVALF